MRLRAEYFAGSNLRFLSNLDMKRMMERSLRRSNLPYALSGGFNPQIKLSMGTVLPVGVWGECEYFDIELQEDITPQAFIDIMNQVLPADLVIKKCIVIDDKAAALMKIINAASYAFLVRKGYALDSLPAKLMNSDKLIVKSRGKKKDIDKDLRPGIFKMEVKEATSFDIIKLWVAVVEPVNVRYDELVDLLTMYGIEYTDIIDINRLGNFIKINDGFYTPIEKVI